MLSQDVLAYLRPGTLGSVATSTGLSQDIPGYLRPGTLGSVATSTHLSQDVLGYPGNTQTWDSRICGYLHRLISGSPEIIPGCPRISQTWDSRICGYLHTHIPGCPGISQDNSDLELYDLWLPPQAYPRISRDYPRISQTWDSRICGYLLTLIPGCPGISQDNSDLEL